MGFDREDSLYLPTFAFGQMTIQAQHRQVGMRSVTSIALEADAARGRVNRYLSSRAAESAVAASICFTTSSGPANPLTGFESLMDRLQWSILKL